MLQTRVVYVAALLQVSSLMPNTLTAAAAANKFNCGNLPQEKTHIKPRTEVLAVTGKRTAQKQA